jgi:D-alanine-D-alanine ligase
MNKAASKRLYEKSGIPTPSYTLLFTGDQVDSEACFSEIGLPMVVKPVVGGSSVGMSIVRAEPEFQAALQLAFAEDNAVMLEPYIQGIELTAAVIGNRELEALPLIEIIPDEAHAFFDYEAKYTAGVTREICPARIDEKITQAAQSYAKKAHQALFCRGYSRTDMILRGEELFVLETNTIPGMTATSLLPQAARVAGLSFTRLLDRLIALSLENS